MIYNKIQLKAYFLIWILCAIQRLYNCYVSENCVEECIIKKVYLLQAGYENTESQKLRDSRDVSLNLAQK